MTLKNRNPQEPRSADQPIKKGAYKFNGMLTGEPISTIPSGFSALNYNVIDRGDYYDVRGGSRQYTSLRVGYSIYSVDTLNDIITTTVSHPWVTGNQVYFKGDDLPSPFAEDTAYYVIKVATNKFKLAVSYTNAIAGTAINITTEGIGDRWLYYGEVNAGVDHVAQEKYVLMIGTKVYVANKAFTSLTEVINLHGTDPSGVSTLLAYDNEAVLLSPEGGIFKVVLSDTFYYMYKLNQTLPSVLITDVVETAEKKYGYLYLYSMAILDGTGNRDRLSKKILFESGTCQKDGQAKDYGEVYHSTEIGVDLSVVHSAGTLTLPDDVNGVTHFPLYRTKNIGENSGGNTASLDGIGNRRDFPVWVADVPAAKAFVVSTITEAGTARIVSGNKFVRGDVSCTLKDTSGNSVEITAFTDEDNATIGEGLASSATLCVAIGGGRVMKVSQTGDTITKSEGDDFTVNDRGLLLYVSDGTYRHVTEYVAPGSVKVAETGDFTNLAITMRPVTGNFSRKWNDTVPDKMNSTSVISIQDMIEYGSDMYVPRRFFEPMPNCDTGIIDNGFLVASLRDGTEYYYSQIGDKAYTMGYYKDPEQKKKVISAVRHIAMCPLKAVVMMRDKTGVISLSSSQNVGRTEIGENVFQLPEMAVVDDHRGVEIWQSVKQKNANLILALTSDGAYRYFDGVSWSAQDLAFVQGKDAVSKEYIKKIDQTTVINSFYSSESGMILWIRKWVRDNAANPTTYRIVQFCDDESEEKWQFDDQTKAERGSGLNDIQMFGVQ